MNRSPLHKTAPASLLVVIIWQQTWTYAAGGMLSRQMDQSLENAVAAAAKPDGNRLERGAKEKTT